MHTVTIVGVGLIGGSFALALRKAGFQGRILGVSSPRTVAEALDLGVIDEAVSLEEACERSDLLYLAQPIERILSLLEELGPLCRSSLLVTDAGSTKQQIVEKATRTLRQGIFIGGHPMAGKEVRGVAAAEADLFEGRPYILTPKCASDLEQPAIQELVEWIRKFGAIPVVMDATLHDRLVAYTSHLPQLLSTALAITIARHVGAEQARQIAGSGLLDMTRLAMSPYEIWQSILVTNREAIGEALTAFGKVFTEIQEQLASGTLREGFGEAAMLAGAVREPLAAPRTNQWPATQ